MWSAIKLGFEIISAVTSIVTSIYSAVQAGRVRKNPVMDEIERRIRAQEQEANEAKAKQAEAESAREKAEEEQRRADEQRKQAEENARRAEEERVRAEEERRGAEEASKKAGEDQRAAEERSRRAAEQARKAEEQRVRAEREARRAQEEQDRADHARRAAEKTAAEARTAREEAERQLREGIRPIIIPTRVQFQETKRRLQYKEGMFHFAVAGVSGSGKSSLINAFRGLRNSDRSAAATGIVETTSEIVRYPDSDPKHPFVWYDVPGAGTLSVPDWQYFTDQGLYIFDCIVVVFDSRFTATDVAILRNCARFQIPTYIVRSKSAQHISNLMADMAKAHNDADSDTEEADPAPLTMDSTLQAAARAQYIQQTRESVKKNLQQAGLPDQRVYLVDKETVVAVSKGKMRKGCIDEVVLLEDLFGEARRRRVVEPDARIG